MRALQPAKARSHLLDWNFLDTAIVSMRRSALAGLLVLPLKVGGSPCVVPRVFNILGMVRVLRIQVNEKFH